MRHTVLTVVVLAIVQTTPKIPRKTPDQPAGGSSNVKNQPQSEQKSAQNSAVTPDNSSPQREQLSASNAQSTVSVSKLPPVSVAKDTWDYLYIAFTSVLIPIGAFGVCAAYKTLKAIEKQANLMQSQFDQWVVLTDWKTWAHPRNNILRITVKLINPTGFPITLSDG
jgi:hypothetical protein